MTVTDNPGGYHGSCATGGPRGTLHISTIIPCYHMIITGCFLGVSSYSVGGNSILTNLILQLYQLLPVHKKSPLNHQYKYLTPVSNTQSMYQWQLLWQS